MVRKEILHAGRARPVFVHNTKVTFHFRTFRLAPDGGPDTARVVDDSRQIGNGPFELVIGRSFKLSVWEEIVQEMCISEVARFTCEPERVRQYSIVAKALRDVAKKRRTGKEIPRHTCGHGAMATGYDDLDDIVTEKAGLVFEVELLKVEQPDEYKQESWLLVDQQKVEAIPKLQALGNELYRKGEYVSAAERYFEALSYLEQLSLKEKPSSEKWTEIEQQKLPFLLNYSQCKMKMGEYRDVIRHTSTALGIDGASSKAYYRRAKAHAACWNVDEARSDYEQLVKLEPGLLKTVERELREIEDRVKQANKQEGKQLEGKKMFGL